MKEFRLERVVFTCRDVCTLCGRMKVCRDGRAIRMGPKSTLPRSVRRFIYIPLQAHSRRLQNRASAGDRRSLLKARPPSYRALCFAALCCFIGAVSVHDAYLLLHNRQEILEHEKNPLGRWLIEAGGGDVMLFIAVKLTTTAGVCGFLVCMYRRYPRQARFVATGVAAFQLALLCYLTGA